MLGKFTSVDCTLIFRDFIQFMSSLQIMLINSKNNLSDKCCIYDKNEISDHEFKYIYDSNLNPKKAVDELKKALKNKSTSFNYLD